MQKGKELYSGKAKVLYETDQPDVLYCEFTNKATAFNAKKKGTIQNKGHVNADLTYFLFKYLEGKGIPTHLIEKIGEGDLLVKSVKIIPVEVVVRNKVAGSMAKALGLPEGQALPFPVIDYYYKSDPLDDPKISADYVLALSYATKEQLDKINQLTRQIAEALTAFFKTIDIDLIDFKLEFGQTKEGEVILADEISPDTCRFWDTNTGEKLDKDRFRRDLGNLEESYNEVWCRVRDALAPQSPVSK